MNMMFIVKLHRFLLFIVKLKRKQMNGFPLQERFLKNIYMRRGKK